MTRTRRHLQLFASGLVLAALTHCAAQSRPSSAPTSEATVSSDDAKESYPGTDEEEGNEASYAPDAPPPPPAPARQGAVTKTETAQTPTEAAQPFGNVPVVARERVTPQMYFKHWGTNPTFDTRSTPLSTFSVDVDTAAYTMTRAYLARSALPPEAAVRVEEVVNAFDYRYEAPTEATFTLVGEAVPSPSRPGYHFLHLGLKAREVSRAARQPAALVFVIDVSGSMAEGGRLELVKRSLSLLVGALDGRDRVAIVVYGTTARVLLEATAASDRERIVAAIEDLAPEGSTNAQAGLELGYRVMASMGSGSPATRRLVLCSDGVANVGLTDADAMFAAIRRESDRGVTLSAVGFGMGNYNDVLMERLAQIGDGNYAYVDREGEAKRLFVDQLTGTLEVVAADAKIQVELDPRFVHRYRLVGYENRVMAARDFRDDRKDAGEVGAGHAVTAIYEVKLASALPPGAVLGTVRVRHKAPGVDVATELARPIPASIVRASLSTASPSTRLSLAAAGFAEKLRGSYWARGWSYEALAGVLGELPAGWRDRADVVELAGMVRRAQQLDRRGDRFEADAPLVSMAYDEVPVVAGRD